MDIRSRQKVKGANPYIRWSLALGLPLLLVGMTGCATYTSPVATQPPVFVKTMNKSFDETWTDLMNYTSQTFFGIDSAEKTSGLLAISFGSAQPSRFIDCGLRDNESYADWAQQKRSATLQGKMNVVVKALEPGRTQIRVNARYSFAYSSLVVSGTTLPGGTWNFNSGEDATVAMVSPLTGAMVTRTCRPTYAAERAVLDAVSP
jgi:hypothetical protein